MKDEKELSNGGEPKEDKKKDKMLIFIIPLWRKGNPKS